MKSHYTVGEFARLAETTVKALHHYDRLGLLRPRRTHSGYRLYVARDFERLQQLVALKSLGFPLKQIGVLLDGDPDAFAAALRLQRQTLDGKRRQLDGMIGAIEHIEATATGSGHRARTRVLSRLVEVIEMQQDIDEMKRYFSEGSWNRARRYFEDWPTEPWRDLFRAVGASRGEDPAGERAQYLAAQWDHLFRKDTTGDFAFRAGLWRALADNKHWPPGFRQRLAEFDFDAMWRFIAEVSWARVGPDGRVVGSDPMRAPDRVSESKIALFQELADSLDRDPTGARIGPLITKWRTLLEQEVGDDVSYKAALFKAWANRAEWPLGFQRYVASLYDVTVETWTKVAGALDANR